MRKRKLQANRVELWDRNTINFEHEIAYRPTLFSDFDKKFQLNEVCPLLSKYTAEFHRISIIVYSRKRVFSWNGRQERNEIQTKATKWVDIECYLACIVWSAHDKGVLAWWISDAVTSVGRGEYVQSLRWPQLGGATKIQMSRIFEWCL